MWNEYKKLLTQYKRWFYEALGELVFQFGVIWLVCVIVGGIIHEG